ncbi:hypothetical protein VNO77_21150 [Canavalia gladiata]|uniref:Uncharacterized protein n=1 Tax=Canavalia gladiata TaxID=3824 RepID=A0AAN9LUZ8_CANGL
MNSTLTTAFLNDSAEFNRPFVFSVVTGKVLMLHMPFDENYYVSKLKKIEIKVEFADLMGGWVSHLVDAMVEFNSVDLDMAASYIISALNGREGISSR